jgi:hypothetical protein
MSILDDLYAERYDSAWWKTPAPEPDSPDLCAWRRRLLDADFRRAGLDASARGAA